LFFFEVLSNLFGGDIWGVQSRAFDLVNLKLVPSSSLITSKLYLSFIELIDSTIGDSSSYEILLSLFFVVLGGVLNKF